MVNKLKVLIADDDAGFRYPLSALFEDHNYEVIEVETESELVARAENNLVWIIDGRLPSSNYEGVRAVKTLIFEKNIWPKKVIFISASPRTLASDKGLDDISKKIGINMWEWVEKPFELEEIFYKVEAVYNDNN